MTNNKCGNCKHFTRIGNTATGRCGKRKFLTDRWRQETDRLFIPSQSRNACVNDFEPVIPKKTTNYERIINMSVEEMANKINDRTYGCVFTRGRPCECENKPKDCVLEIKKWLESEAEDNG